MEAVDCFKCSSRNGSNPACEDPFHNINSTRVITPILPEVQPQVIYHSPCYAGKKGREGLFPASACIKLVGTFGEYSFSGCSCCSFYCYLNSFRRGKNSSGAKVLLMAPFDGLFGKLKGIFFSLCLYALSSNELWIGLRLARCAKADVARRWCSNKHHLTRELLHKVMDGNLQDYVAIRSWEAAELASSFTLVSLWAHCY